MTMDKLLVKLETEIAAIKFFNANYEYLVNHLVLSLKCTVL